MTRYNVLVTRRAERDIIGLDFILKKRIHKALLSLADYPFEKAKKLNNTDLGQFRLRVGDWRIVFDIEGKDVVVLRVGHRKEIYRRA
jgi:mRNA interferase RelE/StbE